jgi:hypothetical protein
MMQRLVAGRSNTSSLVGRLLPLRLTLLAAAAAAAAAPCLQLHGVSESHSAAAKPLALLNDKRHGPSNTTDRRMILDVDGVAANLSAAYPGYEVSTTCMLGLALHG